MIDYEQLKAAIDTKLSTDPEFRTIMKRVTAGRATFIDTSRYSEVIAHALGQELSKYVLELTDREAITKQLLHDNYEDINDVFGRVQRDIDKKKGLTLKPQQAPFPEERVEQYAHALLDPTVEDNVIKRRARAGSETITKSFHDDCIEKNAEFHEEAGLKCYIIRMGTNCCQWCSDVAGKYEMKNQPEGIFRRHDNCDCTIIYDGQVLRGQTGNNGKSSKKWVEVSKDAGATAAPRLSQEQAKQLNDSKVKINKTSIDNNNESGIIKEKSNTKHNQNGLHPFGENGNTGSDLFSAEAKTKLLQREKEINEYRTEKAIVFSSDGTELYLKDGDANSVTFSEEECKEIKGCIITHNHPNNSPFSPDDIGFMLENELSEIRDRINGGTYILQRTTKTLKEKPTLNAVENAFYDEYERLGKKYSDIAARNGTSIIHYLRKLEEETVMFIAKKYGLNFRLEVDNYG